MTKLQQVKIQLAVKATAISYQHTEAANSTTTQRTYENTRQQSNTPGPESSVSLLPPLTVAHFLAF